MITKKYKNSEVKWDDEQELGSFKVTSNRGKSARGVVKKSREGKLLALIENTDYANSYAHQKVQSTLNLIFDNPTQKVVMQSTIVCLQGFIYTDISKSKGLFPNDSHTLSGSYTCYCVRGAHDCGGKTYQGPTPVVYIGAVIGVCAGTAVEYAKFKIN